jgi:hypothetical protein
MKTRFTAGHGSLLMAGARARLWGALAMMALLWLAVGWASSS